MKERIVDVVEAQTLRSKHVVRRAGATVVGLLLTGSAAACGASEGVSFEPESAQRTVTVGARLGMGEPGTLPNIATEPVAIELEFDGCDADLSYDPLDSQNPFKEVVDAALTREEGLSDISLDDSLGLPCDTVSVELPSEVTLYQETQLASALNGLASDFGLEGRPEWAKNISDEIGLAQQDPDVNNRYRTNETLKRTEVSSGLSEVESLQDLFDTNFDDYLRIKEVDTGEYLEVDFRYAEFLDGQG